MAKILITFWQSKMGDSLNNLICYYESFTKELKDCGNEVLLINKSLFANDYFKPDVRHQEYLMQKVKDFNPDLIVAFNNQVFNGLFESTSCPVLLFDADASYLFSSKETIKKHLDRYFMVTHYNSWENSYPQLGFSKDRVCTIHIATSLKKEEKNQDKNISFIGTKFLCHLSPNIKKILDNNGLNLYKMLLEHWSSHNFAYEELMRKYCNEYEYNDFDIVNIFDYRSYVLSSVLDLGLSLYGVDWRAGEDNNIALMSAFDDIPKFSLKHNQDVYNESKICLSISHPQTRGYAFPWRVYDIMATNGLLISSRSDLLNELTKGIVKIPMYESPYEARELCLKYLKDENLRNDIVAASNEFIEKCGRWKDNFKTIQDITGVRLINQAEQTVSDFAIVECLDSDKNEKCKKKSALKTGLKNIINGFSLILMSLPLIRFLFSQKVRQKVYNSIIKYRDEEHD